MKDYTHIVFLLDRSGSMERMRAEAIGGFNGLVEDQRKETGESSKCTISLYQFDHSNENVFSFKDIHEVEELTREVFKPRGATALRDAIYETAIREQKAIHELSEEQRPELVMFIIITDGEDNTSDRDNTSVKNLLAELESTNWSITFIGAGRNALKQSKDLGIDPIRAATFNAVGAAASAAFESVSSVIGQTRNVVAMSFSPEEATRNRKTVGYSEVQRELMKVN